MDPTLDDQRAYWDRVAAEKTFSHPLRLDRFGPLVERPARILDFGCGYGRTLAELAAQGYPNGIGVDSSPKMIRRGKTLFPALDLRVANGLPLPFESGSFDCAILFAVLTCIPSDEGQRAIVGELRRILRPGGVLYVSDLLLQTDDRNRERYERSNPGLGPYGVFRLPDGGVMRHHNPAWIRKLLSDFPEAEFKELEVATMNGNAARGFQFLGRKR